MATQLTLNDGSLNSAGALALKTNGTTQAINITTGQQVEFNDGSDSAPSITNTGDTNTGVFFPAADTVGITTGGTERARVDSSGNLGLGVTPSAFVLSGFRSLEIGAAGSGIFSGPLDQNLLTNAYYNSGWKYAGTGVAIRYQMNSGEHRWYNASSGTAGGTITWTQAMTLDASGNLLLGTTSGTSKFTISGSNNPIQMLNSGGANQSDIDFLDAQTLRIRTYHASGSAISFATNPSGGGNTERARIDSSGNLLVGTTNTTFSSGGIRLYANNSIESVRDGSSGSSVANVYLNKTGSTNGSIISFNRSGTEVGTISVTGSATAYNTSSDYRLKDITGSLTGYKERLSALQPKQGSWKADGSYFRGFLAHEFAESYPASVAGEKDAVDADGKPQYQGMQAGSSEVIADLVAYIKELETRLTALEQA